VNQKLIRFTVLHIRVHGIVGMCFLYGSKLRPKTIWHWDPIMTFIESEGLTLILAKQTGLLDARFYAFWKSAV